jgi:putative ABC transport system permease protein
MRLSSIAHLYRVRLRARNVLVQELLAILGLAVGVALLFSSQVASASLSGSVTQLTNGVVGDSTYQLQARSAQGFSGALLGAVQRLPGVKAAIPVLEQQIGVSGPKGSRSVDLIATDPRYVRLAGPLLRHFQASRLLRQRVIALPVPIAEAIGTGPLQIVDLRIGQRVVHALVGAELNARSIGSLVNSPVAVAPLPYAQELTQMRGRITRIFVQVQPGGKREVRAGLARLANDRLNVDPANFDVTLFGVAAAPADKGESLFSGISALVGFLFAFNAMLLTLPLRQSLIRGLRANGAKRSEMVKALLFDALVLASLAALVGLALGDLLSVAVFRSNPGYLSFAFPVGSQRIVTWQSVAIAVGAGLAAACIGVLIALREAFSRSTTVPAGHRHRSQWVVAGSLLGGLLCIGATTAILLFAPQAAVLGSVLLALALLMLLAVLLAGTVAVFARVQDRFGSAATRIAVIELHSPQTRTRSLAIAATGAVAVFGSVAIQGAQSNLQQGLDHVFHDVTAVADLWVVPRGAQDLLATTSFASNNAEVSALARVPGVEAVSLYRSGFLDYGDRRVWVLAPPQSVADPIPPSQLVRGNLALAVRRLHSGGWAVISQVIAAQSHLHIGQAFTLPAPYPMKFRVAALATNLGWPPGAIILNSEDYARAWSSTDPGAYGLKLRPGASAPQVRESVQSALGAGAGLVVETARQRESLQRAASRQGLSRLSQIATLVTIATVLALFIAMGTLIWQRRPRLARMKVQGYERGVLWRALLWESGVLLGAGCAIGAVFGVYGQLLISHALATVTGFPIVFSAGAPVAIVSFALVSVLAVALVGVLGLRAVAVRPNV